MSNKLIDEIISDFNKISLNGSISREDVESSKKVLSYLNGFYSDIYSISEILNILENLSMSLQNSDEGLKSGVGTCVDVSRINERRMYAKNCHRKKLASLMNEYDNEE